MTYRKWLQKIRRYWKTEYKLSLFEVFPNIYLRSEYQAGRDWQAVSAMLTKWVIHWSIT